MTGQFVTGEALQAVRALVPTIGTTAPLDSGSTSSYSDPVALHSMLLAWAMASNSSFASQIRALPRLFALMDDAHLFSAARLTLEQDFFSLLMKHEEATGLFTRFTNDMAELSSSFPSASETVTDALIALTIAHYYQMSNGYDSAVGEAVKAIQGGVELSIGHIDWNEEGSDKAYAMLREMANLLAPGLDGRVSVSQLDRLVVSDATALAFSDLVGAREFRLWGSLPIRLLLAVTTILRAAAAVPIPSTEGAGGII